MCFKYSRVVPQENYILLFKSLYNNTVFIVLIQGKLYFSILKNISYKTIFNYFKIKKITHLIRFAGFDKELPTSSVLLLIVMIFKYRCLLLRKPNSIWRNSRKKKKTNCLFFSPLALLCRLHSFPMTS